MAATALKRFLRTSVFKSRWLSELFKHLSFDISYSFLYLDIVSFLLNMNLVICSNSRYLFTFKIKYRIQRYYRLPVWYNALQVWVFFSDSRFVFVLFTFSKNYLFCFITDFYVFQHNLAWLSLEIIQLLLVLKEFSIEMSKTTISIQLYLSLFKLFLLLLKVLSLNIEDKFSILALGCDGRMKVQMHNLVLFS